MTIPAALKGETILWQGVDSTTPTGYTLVTAHILGIVTTYVLRDGQIIGRIWLGEWEEPISLWHLEQAVRLVRETDAKSAAR